MLSTFLELCGDYDSYLDGSALDGNLFDNQHGRMHSAEGVKMTRYPGPNESNRCMIKLIPGPKFAITARSQMTSKYATALSQKPSVGLSVRMPP